MLTTIGEHLALNDPDGIFTGQIRDYKDDEGMLASEELFQRISTGIETCQARIDAFNNEMQGDWKAKLLKDL